MAEPIATAPSRLHGRLSQQATPEGARIVKEPFYSNEDIAVIHEIVTAAQKELDDVFPRKPPPAAALFRAYDDVLPKHGYDPEEDHALSALIFRVGGERDGGSLVDSLQRILTRMNIKLLFDDVHDVAGEDDKHYARRLDRPAVIRRGNSDPQGVSGVTFSIDDTVQGQRETHDLQSPSIICPRSTAAQQSSTSHRLGRVAAAQARDSVENDNVESAAHHTLTRKGLLSNTAEGRESRPRLDSTSSSDNIPLRKNHREFEMVQLHREQTQLRASTARRSGLGAMAQTSRRNVEGQAIRDMEGLFNKDGRPVQIGVPVREQALLSVMDKWKNLVIRRQEQVRALENDATVNSWGKGPETSHLRHVGNVQESDHEPDQGTFAARAVEHAYAFDEERDTIALAKTETEMYHPLPLGDLHPLEVSLFADTGLLERARRARGIFLASKVFNIWADKTAKRLEREAVARRHMVRFRCFRGWLQAPTLQTPVADHFRERTAVCKLRRAVREQNRQLKEVAFALEQRYEVALVKRAVGTWLEQASMSATQNFVSRGRLGTIMPWQDRRSEELLPIVPISHKRGPNLTASLHRWLGSAAEHAARALIAQRVHTIRTKLINLGYWKERLDLSKRSQLYRSLLLRYSTVAVLCDWSLRTRAQACVWRTEFRAATQCANKWSDIVGRDGRQRYAAIKKAQTYRSAQLRCRLWRKATEWALLERIEVRVNFFIAALKGLAAIDLAAKAHHRQVVKQQELRQQQEANRARTYLAAAHITVSAESKKRKFMKAFITWKTASSKDHSTEDQAKAHHQKSQLSRCACLWRYWDLAPDALLEQEHQIHKADSQLWLRAWREGALQQDATGLRAWSLWSTRVRRQYLRSWTIISLSHGGQSFAATTFRRRCERYQWGRVTQRWCWLAGVTSMRKSIRAEGTIITEQSAFSGSRLGGQRRSGNTIAKSSFDNDAVDETPLPTPSRSRRTRFLSDAQGEFKNSSSVATGASMDYSLPSTTPRNPPPLHLINESRVSSLHGGRRLSSAKPSWTSGLGRPRARQKPKQPKQIFRHSLAIPQVADGWSDLFSKGPSRSANKLFVSVRDDELIGPIEPLSSVTDVSATSPIALKSLRASRLAREQIQEMDGIADM